VFVCIFEDVDNFLLVNRPDDRIRQDPAVPGLILAVQTKVGFTCGKAIRRDHAF
jgi:hypothetical protein